MNKISLLGRMTYDPETFTTANGKKGVKFVIAVDRLLSRDKKEQYKREGKQTADFFRCASYGFTADHIDKYARKGARILVDGSMNLDQKGEDTYPNVYVKDAQVIDFNVDKKSTPATDFGNDFAHYEDDDDIPF